MRGHITHPQRTTDKIKTQLEQTFDLFHYLLSLISFVLRVTDFVDIIHLISL
jgi:hypothetical protein